ncbi:MAG: hypothetical protein IJ848_02880 [Alphaproteobacteria bacterium]|nr:hypothetical protein [Alphaproteobacteria bacterium]
MDNTSDTEFIQKVEQCAKKSWPISKEDSERYKKITGRSISSIMFDGDEDDMNDNENNTTPFQSSYDVKENKDEPKYNPVNDKSENMPNPFYIEDNK